MQFSGHSILLLKLGGKEMGSEPFLLCGKPGLKNPQGSTVTQKQTKTLFLKAAQALLYDLVPVLFTMTDFATISEYTFFFA